MRYSIIGCIFLIGIFSCKKQHSEEVSNVLILNGVISQPGFDNVSFIDIASISGLNTQVIKPQPDGTLQDTLFVDHAGFYLLNYGRQGLVMYAEPGSEIGFTSTYKDFGKDVKFTGDFAKENHFLNTVFQKMNDTIQSLSEEIYLKDEEAFLQAFKNIQKTTENIINAEKEGVKNTVVEFVQNNYKYELLQYKNQYPLMHAMQIQKQYEPSEKMKKELQPLYAQNDSIVMFVPNYRNYLINLQEEKMREMMQQKKYDNKQSSPVYVMMDVLKQDSLMSPLTKEYILGDFASKFDYVKGNPHLEKVHDSLQKVLTQVDLKNQLQQLYTAFSGPEKGIPAPTFSMLDVAQKKDSLSAYKGKNVVLYFWSVYDPAMDFDVMQINSFYDTYKDKVQFIMVNLEGKNKWNNAIQKYQCKAEQRWVPNGFQSNMAQQYGLYQTLLPVSVLIDRKGNIIEGRGGKPWNDELLSKIDSIQ